MGRNNICVIYDSDENYAKRLMSVINDDNDIPYNAQVFTKEHELDKYLQEKEADMLTFICISTSYSYLYIILIITLPSAHLLPTHSLIHLRSHL